MNKQDQKFLEQWPKQEEKGMLQNVLLYGSIWGILTAVFSNVFRLDQGSLAELYLSTDFLLRLFIFTIVGLLLAASRWRKNKKRYDQLVKQSE